MEGIALIKSLRPDLIFLDIQMPGMNGLEMLKQLEYIPQVIFTTAHDEYAIQAFESKALDYLLKPIDPKRLNVALQKIAKQDDFESNLSKEKRASLGLQDKIFVKENEKLFFVELKEVICFESDGNYVKVHLEKATPTVIGTLNSIEEKLDSKYFFRANRQYVVNLSYVQLVENWFNGGYRFTLKNGNSIDVSRRQSVQFKDAFEL
jgi:two-component system LytT family response regulator